MQFNTLFLQDLSKYGIKPDHVANPGCYAYDLAAWRVRPHIKNDKDDIWTRAANYHSRTPKYNSKCHADLIVKTAKWTDWIKKCFIMENNKIPDAYLD